MPHFSKASIDRLETCHPLLQEVCNEAIKDYDFMVVYGHREEADQNEAYATGRSKLKWPNSKHNSTPSIAVDLAPVKYVDGKATIPWNDIPEFRRMAMHIMNVANNKGISLEWGGSWVSFKDYPHFQLTKEVQNGKYYFCPARQENIHRCSDYNYSDAAYKVCRHSNTWLYCR